MCINIQRFKYKFGANITTVMGKGANESIKKKEKKKG